MHERYFLAQRWCFFVCKGRSEKEGGQKEEDGMNPHTHNTDYIEKETTKMYG